jgi:precorrin-6B methylase 1
MSQIMIDQIVRQQEEIEDLRRQLEDNRKRVKMLREAIAGLMPWVVTQVVACNGLKCRALVCESCSCDVEENAQKACDSYSSANKALADTASEDQAK